MELTIYSRKHVLTKVVQIYVTEPPPISIEYPTVISH